MKISTIGIAGLLIFLVLAKIFGWCPGNSCSTRTTSNASVATTSPVEQVRSDNVGVFIPLEKALADARSENKLLMIDVYTDWCVWCKRLDHDVYPDPGVQKELRTYFTAVKINAESPALHSFNGQQLTESQLASNWKVSGYPTVLFLSPNGEVLETLPGYLPPKDFAQVLRYMGTGAYKAESFEKWQSEHSS